jgi:hypothetical protein
MPSVLVSTRKSSNQSGRTPSASIGHVADLDAVDRPFVHIARVVRDLGGWHEFTHMVERPTAERRLPPVRQRDLTVGRWRKAVHQSHHLDTSKAVV